MADSYVIDRRRDLADRLGGPDRLSWRRPLFGLLFVGCVQSALGLGWIDQSTWLSALMVLIPVLIAGEAVPAAITAARRGTLEPLP